MKLTVAMVLGMLVGPGSEVVAREKVYRYDRVLLGYYPVRLMVMGSNGDGKTLVGWSRDGMAWWRRPGEYWVQDNQWEEKGRHPRVHKLPAKDVRVRDVIKLVLPDCELDY